MMKKVLLMTTLLTTVFVSNVQAEALIITDNTELNQSAIYDYLEVQEPASFHFYGDGNILRLTGNQDSSIDLGAFFIQGDESEISLASGRNLNIHGESFIAEGSPSLYTKNVGGKTFFDAEKYKALPLPGMTRISGNVSFSNNMNSQIGGVLSVLTANREVVNKLDYSSEEYSNLVSNNTITEYETPARLSVDGSLGLAFSRLNFTKNSYLEVSETLRMGRGSHLTGDIDLKSNILIETGPGTAGFSGENLKLVGNIDANIGRFSLSSENARITGDINVKNVYFSMGASKTSTIFVTGNISNAGEFSVGTGAATSKTTLSIADGYALKNTGSLYVDEGSSLDGCVNHSTGGEIQGTGTIRDLHISENVDASTIFTGTQTNVKNLHLENNAVMTGPNVFFDTLNGGTFKLTGNMTNNKSLELNNTTFDLGGYELEYYGDHYPVTLNNTSLQNGTLWGPDAVTITNSSLKDVMIRSDEGLTFKGGVNTLSGVEIFCNGIVNEKGSTVSVLKDSDVETWGLYNEGVLDVQGNLYGGVYHLGGVITGAGMIEEFSISNDVSKLSDILKDEIRIENFYFGRGRSITYDVAAKAKFGLIHITAGGKLILEKDLSIDYLYLSHLEESSANLSLEKNKATNSFGGIGSTFINLGTNTLTVTSGRTIVSDSSLYITVTGDKAGEYGQFKTDRLSMYDAELVVSVKSNSWQKGETKELPLFVTNELQDSFELTLTNLTARYKIEDTATPGTYAITCLQTAADIADLGGGSQGIQDGAKAWDDGSLGDNPSTTQGQISSVLNELSNTPGKEKEYVEALSTLAPSVKPIAQIQSVDTTVSAINTVYQRINKRMSVGKAVQRNNRSSGFRGRSGGASNLTESVWVQGIYNKTKFDVQDGFESTTFGIAGGVDTRTPNGLVGFAMSFADLESEENTNRKTDAMLYTGMLYGEYRLKHFFINGVLSGTYGDYEEQKNVSGINVAADYGVYTAGGQLLFGYDFLGISPLLGARYFYAYQEDYKDAAGQEISSDALHTATALGGFRFTPVLRATDGVFVIPEIKVLAAYDFVEPSENKSVVNVGGSSYNIVENEEDKLDRFGVEASASITVDLGKLEASLRYEGAYKKDYESHTGIFELRYNF